MGPIQPLSNHCDPTIIQPLRSCWECWSVGAPVGWSSRGRTAFARLRDGIHRREEDVGVLERLELEGEDSIWA